MAKVTHVFETEGFNMEFGVAGMIAGRPHKIWVATTDCKPTRSLGGHRIPHQTHFHRLINVGDSVECEPCEIAAQTAARLARRRR
jgi:hypothetical protein